jgi:hypothetical protein
LHGHARLPLHPGGVVRLAGTHNAPAVLALLGEWPRPTQPPETQKTRKLHAETLERATRRAVGVLVTLHITTAARETLRLHGRHPQVESSENRKFFDTAPFYEKNFWRIFLVEKTKKYKKNIKKNVKQSSEKSGKIGSV